MNTEEHTNPLQKLADYLIDTAGEVLLGVPQDISQRRRELRSRGERPPGPFPKWDVDEPTPGTDYWDFKEKDWDKVREHLGLPTKSNMKNSSR